MFAYWVSKLVAHVDWGQVAVAFVVRYLESQCGLPLHFVDIFGFPLVKVLLL